MRVWREKGRDGERRMGGWEGGRDIHDVKIALVHNNLQHLPIIIGCDKYLY